MKLFQVFKFHYGIKIQYLQFLFRLGTIVSSIISAGTIITSSYYIDNKVPIIGLCSEFINEYNGQFWHRDFKTELSLNSSFLMDEILYYENFFEDLKNAESTEKKIEIYTEQIYPMLSATWTTFAASGYLDNPFLSALQVEYSGVYPGREIVKNYANETFPTIAPSPFIHNLIEDGGYLEETALYLAKPFYENVAYYIALMTKEIMNMQTFNKNGYGVPTDGWRQTYIEFKGYNSYYENSKNLTELSVTPSKLVDCDRPLDLCIITRIYLFIL